MNWVLVHKSKTDQPATGGYSDWKQQIASECFFQCVYCAIHESQFGGTINYHIDHFRPYSKFESLANDILNLFYACPICNRFKSDDWPGEPHLDQVSYPDPSKIDYNTLFDFDDRFNLLGLYVSARYIINRLFLNRGQLIFERRETSLRSKGNELIKEIKSLVDQLAVIDTDDAFSILNQIDSIKNNLLGLEEYRRKIRPYEVIDIRKK